MCDRCGLWWNRSRLSNQNDWRGAALLPLYIFVCPDCLDVPAEQLRAITLPADPLPVYLAKPETFVSDESNWRAVSQDYGTDPTTGLPLWAGNYLVAQDGQNMATQQVGPPLGLTQAAVQPLLGTTHYGVALDLISVTATGTPVVTVTCRAAHDLSTGSQVAVEGLSNTGACGFYSVTVTTAMAFAYETNQAVPASALLTSTTLITTALVGLPLDTSTIPATGI